MISGYAGKVYQNWLQAAVMLLLAVGAVRANSHALEQSYLYLDLNQQRLQGRFELTVTDLNRALSLALPADGGLQPADLLSHGPRIARYLQSRVELAPDGVVSPMTFGSPGLMSTRKAQYVLLPFTTGTTAHDIGYIDVDYRVLFDVHPAHRGFLMIENDWRTGTFDNEGGISLVFEPQGGIQRLDLTASTTVRGFVEMVKLGVHHIWDGIDHLLFLLALLLPAVVKRRDGRWEPVEDFGSALIHVVKIVTLFTIAHTITLSAATLGAIDLSPRLVESVIAISITIAALDIFWPMFRGAIWWVVFAFGLFHGFGFASVLSDIGIPPGYTALSLLAFNLGVELGQIAVVCAAFSLFYLLRRSSLYVPVFMKCGAAGLIAVSLYWFCERAFLVDLPAGEILNYTLSSLGLRDA
jgi:hypothetical protein